MIRNVRVPAQRGRPALLQSREREEHLRVWSAGALGQELLIAMLLAEILGSEQFANA